MPRPQRSVRGRMACETSRRRGLRSSTRGGGPGYEKRVTEGRVRAVMDMRLLGRWLEQLNVGVGSLNKTAAPYRLVGDDRSPRQRRTDRGRRGRRGGVSCRVRRRSDRHLAGDVHYRRHVSRPAALAIPCLSHLRALSHTLQRRITGSTSVPGRATLPKRDKVRTSDRCDACHSAYIISVAKASRHTKHNWRTSARSDTQSPRTRSPNAHALTAYLRLGKWMSFFFCLSVFAFFSVWKAVSLETPYGDAMETHRRQPPTDGPRPLRPEVKGEVLLSLVVLPEVLSLLCVDDRQHPCD